MMVLSLKLILAHIVGDFVVQPDKWVQDKEQRKQRSPYLYWHLLIHALALGVVLQFAPAYWGAIATIVGSHFFIDLTKLHLRKKLDSRTLFILDQLAHLSVIALVVYWYESYKFSVEIFYEPKIVLLLTALLSVSIVSAIIMKVIMTQWSFEEDGQDDSLKNAGKYIGILERLFVFGFIILNQWQAIGFLLAAKSVFRFGDLSRAKDRKLTEYILIGTLISFGLAVAIGLCYVHLKEVIAKQ